MSAVKSERPSAPEGGGRSATRLSAHSPHYRRRKLTNSVMLALTGLAAILAVVPLVWIVAYVAREGGRFISLTFLTALPTPVGVPGGGIVNALVGSVLVVGVACVLAVPISIVAALYAFDRPHTTLGVALRFGTDVLAGVPSIVMGIFAYTVVVLPQRHFSAFSGGVALAIIMVPIVLSTTAEMLKLVPRQWREGALALGAPEWKTALEVLLPATLNGVLTGIMLAVARVAGEAAPMLFTAFGNPYLNTDINQPMATLPLTIYNYAISPYRDWHDKAWTTALVLIVLVLGLNITARGVAFWRTRKLGLR